MLSLSEVVFQKYTCFVSENKTSDQLSHGFGSTHRTVLNLSKR